MGATGTAQLAERVSQKAQATAHRVGPMAGRATEPSRSEGGSG